jgi:transforming growth factor-beta-induced protein
VGIEGLVETLKGDGPFTVFAPTDEAFAKLPAGTGREPAEAREQGDPPGQILTYHVVPGKVTAGQVVNLKNAKTANGQQVDIMANANGVKIDNANVVKTDIMTSNGVIHVIDRVILPSSKNIVQTADEAGSFGTLIAAAKAAGLAGVLSGDGPFTVFAPTDEAFQALGSTVNELLKPENKHKLAGDPQVPRRQGPRLRPRRRDRGRRQDPRGRAVSIGIDNGRLTANDANILMTDIDASNGVIHVIDTVLIPE